MSNALSLSAASAQAAPAPSAAGQAMEPAGNLLLFLTALGVCVLAVLAVRYIRRPRRLSLAGTPERANALAIQVLLPFVVWLGAMNLAHLLPEPQWRLVGAAGAQIAFLAACLGVAAKAFRLGLRSGMGLNCRHWLYDSLRAVIAYLAVLPVCLGLLLATTALLKLLLPEQLAFRLIQDHVLLEVLRSLPGWWKALPVFIAVVLAPLAEEVFFRGLLQSMFRRFARPWTAIALTSVIFALLHVQSAQTVPALLALSLVLGYNYERTGRLYAPILIHALFNGVFVACRLTGV